MRDEFSSYARESKEPHQAGEDESDEVGAPSTAPKKDLRGMREEFSNYNRESKEPH